MVRSYIKTEKYGYIRHSQNNIAFVGGSVVAALKISQRSQHGGLSETTTWQYGNMVKLP